MRSKRVFLPEMIQCTSKAKEAVLERFRGILEGVPNMIWKHEMKYCNFTTISHKFLPRNSHLTKTGN